MIAIAKSHVGFRAKQKAVRPVVYFDNWAWRLFSEDKLLKKRFVSTLVEKRGTLVVSWFGLAEFSIYSDSKHGEAADDLIEAVFPHLVFFNSDFFQVAAAERQLPCSGTIAMLCYEQDVFKAYAEGWLRGRPPRLHRIFQTPAFRQQLDDVLTNIAARIEAFDSVYSRFRADSLVSRIAKKPGTWEFPPDAAPIASMFPVACPLFLSCL